MVGWAASVSAPPVGKRATSLLAGRTGRQPPWSTITGFSCWGVRVHGLASRVLDLAAARLTGKPPTAHDRPTLTFRPTSPVIARRERCNRPTSGTPPGAGVKGVARSAKPLATDWKERLCREPERTIGLAPEAPRSDGGTGVRAQHVTAGGAWWGVRGRRVLASPTIFPKKPDSGKSTPVEPEGNPHSRMHGRTLPQGARGSGSPGHDDADSDRAFTKRDSVQPISTNGQPRRSSRARTIRHPAHAVEESRRLRLGGDRELSFRFPRRPRMVYRVKSLVAGGVCAVPFFVGWLETQDTPGYSLRGSSSRIV